MISLIKAANILSNAIEAFIYISAAKRHMLYTKMVSLVLLFFHIKDTHITCISVSSSDLIYQSITGCDNSDIVSLHLRDDVTQVASDLLEEMLNGVVCMTDHTADRLGIRKCKPGKVCTLFKRFYKTDMGHNPLSRRLTNTKGNS